MNDLPSSNTADLDMNRICRLCCTEKNRMRPLFQNRSKYPFPLCQMIYATAQIEVDPNDKMPQKICKQCVSNLIRMFETIDSYRENDLKLRQQLERTTILDDTEDVAGALVACIQEKEAEVGGKDCTGPVQTNGNHDKQNAIAEGNDTWTLTGMNICIKEEPVIYDDIVEGMPTEQNLRIKEEEGVFEKQSGGRRSTRLSIGTKGQSLEEHNGEKDATLTNRNLELYVPKVLSMPEPVQKRPRGRPKSKKLRPKLSDHKCFICKSEAHDSAGALLAHMNSTHKDVLPFTCPDCVMEKIVLTNLLNLNAHLRRHLNPAKCPHCDKRYLSKCKVDVHVKQQHRDILVANSKGPKNCKKCDKKFPSMAKLLDHEKRVHTTSKPVSCATCKETFPDGARLRTHIHRKHGGDIKKFECSICHKKVAKLPVLQKHMEIYHTTPGTEIKCSYCPKTFSTKSLARAHEKENNCKANSETQEGTTQSKRKKSK